ncbi:MAG: alkaline phosphatase family protein [Actinobacteria bacterium]|nr:alkaline phosphatase family protein [Actinomycetota bacterium]
MINNIGVESRRIAIIGLDGTPYSFLKTEIEAGTLPNLGSLLSRGEFRQMETEIPAISSVAWASFMTGVNPGEHGIYGFTDRKPGTYEITFPNYSDLKAEPVWNRLSREGKRCCVINVPSTYPAQPLNGILVAGFVAPNLERAVYPSEAFDYLNRSGYRIDVDAAKARESLDAFLEDLHFTLEKRREAAIHFLESERWDFFMCVFTGTDRLHHFMWKKYSENDLTYKKEFLDYYRRVDEIIGELADLLPEDVSLLMLSDHGFCPIRNELYLNTCLKEAGWLSFRNDEPRSLADMDPLGSRVYCLDPSRIYLNLAGREPEGIVKNEDAAGLIDEVKDFIEELRAPDTGEKVIDRVLRRDELYSGPMAGMGPDLVAIPRRGFDLKGRIMPQSFDDKPLFEGMHTHDDAFSFVDSSIIRRAPGHIREYASVIRSPWTMSGD